MKRRRALEGCAVKVDTGCERKSTRIKMMIDVLVRILAIVIGDKKMRKLTHASKNVPIVLGTVYCTTPVNSFIWLVFYEEGLRLE
jgi:hypothetical protein